MGNTYTQIHIQVVFAVRYRAALLAPEWRENLFKYMTAIIKEDGHKPLAVGGVDNHVHILLGFRPTQSLSDFVLKLKRNTSEWINKEGFTRNVFRWQGGFGAFSYSKSQIPRVIRYIMNQEAHHAKQSFRDEYVGILEKNGVEYDERYLLDDI